MAMEKRATVEHITGRSLHLRSLDQARVYEGLLEGLPTREMNRRHIECLLAEMKSTTSAVHLIPPVERSLQMPDDRPYPFGEPAEMPGVSCIGRFRSNKPARNALLDYSELTILWFQHDFAFPIEAEILQALRQLDWVGLSQDYEL
jgi:hypothetical protein